MERWQYEFDSMLALGERREVKSFDRLSVTAYIDDYVGEMGDLPDVYDVRDALGYSNTYDGEIQAELNIYERDDERWLKS